MASTRCLQSVGARLAARGPPFDDAQISNAFWDADMDLGLAGEMSGTTATVALVEQHADGNSLDVVLAWVGDSAAIRVDMEMKPEHALVESTPMHKRAAGRTSDRASTHDITATRTLSCALALGGRACAAAALSLRMRAACLTPVALLTPSRRPENEAEIARLQALWAARAALGPRLFRLPRSWF